MFGKDKYYNRWIGPRIFSLKTYPMNTSPYHKSFSNPPQIDSYTT
jgi:hypothetical protein